MSDTERDYDGLEQMLDIYFNPAKPPPFEARALDHPARVDAFPDTERNAQGYRSDPFDARGDLNIAIVGCSWTEGEGVARGAIYPDLVKAELSKTLGLDVRVWNFGQSASGMDYAARIMPSVLGLKPDFVVAVFSGPDRREYFSADGRRMIYGKALAGLIDANPEKMQTDLICSKDVVRAFAALDSKAQDLAIYAMNARAISSFLRGAQIPWVYTCIDSPGPVEMMEHCRRAGLLDAAHFLGDLFRKGDFASASNPHPGPESHQVFSKLIVQAVLSAKRPENTSGAPASFLARLASSFRKKPKIEKMVARSGDANDTYPLW